MHIPENYLSPSTCAVLGAAMMPVWIMSIQKIKKEVPKEKLPLLGICAAFSFLSMMFNIPLPGGTTGHAVGGTLIAILFGPYAACLAVSVALFIQALFFGDGGILAFGANCFNMAFVLPFSGYFVYKLLHDKVSEVVAASLGAYVGINLAALFAAIEFGIQPLMFVDASGQALYCPYPLSISVPAMMIGHLTIFGLAEVIFTAALLSYLQKTSPGMFNANKSSNIKPAYLLTLALIILTPLGLIAEGTAWGEWGADEIAEVESNGHVLGYTPSGMETGFEFESMFPDYSVSGMPEVFGYILSAIIGTTLLILIFKILASLIGGKTNYEV